MIFLPLFYVHQQADIAQNARIDVSVSFEEDSRSCSIRCFFDATFETWWRIPIFELAVPLKRLVYSFFRASFVYRFFSLISTYSFLPLHAFFCTCFSFFVLFEFLLFFYYKSVLLYIVIFVYNVYRKMKFNARIDKLNVNLYAFNWLTNC